MEIWKAVPGTSDKIEVSNEGRVRSLLRGSPKILKAQLDQKGYRRVRVTINRVKSTFKVHRLVAQCFLENPEQLPQVNHKDGNKQNNNVTNLEWISNIDNAHHAIANGLWDAVFDASKRNSEKQKIPVIGYKVDDCLITINYYNSVREAENDIGSKHVSAVLTKKRPHTKGWVLQYAKQGGGA